MENYVVYFWKGAEMSFHDSFAVFSWNITQEKIWLMRNSLLT